MTRNTTALFLLGMTLMVTGACQAAEVNLYSARKEALIKPLLDRFATETGIQVNLVTGKADALLQRLKSEGPNSPADILLTVDAGRLHRAKEMGLLQPVTSDVINGNVPARYRDPEGFWFGLSLRARTIMYAKNRIDAAQLSTYADLADPRWQGRICIRSSDNIYNQSMVAAMIAHQGVEATEQWARGLVANFARPPHGGDRDQIKAVAAGQCDIAVANTYYLAMMLDSKQAPEREAAGDIGVFWPDQEGRGVHLNVSGAAMTSASRNRAEAQRLLEYLSQESAQQWYAETNHEYPVKAGIAIGPVLRSWGEFRADTLDLVELGRNNEEAVRLMDRAGWK